MCPLHNYNIDDDDDDVYYTLLVVIIICIMFVKLRKCWRM